MVRCSRSYSPISPRRGKHRRGDLLRLARPAEGHVLEQLLVARGIAEDRLGALLVERDQAVGGGRAGVDADHADAVGVRRAAERAREGHQTGVAGAAAM
jgi:hypothetical protein